MKRSKQINSKDLNFIKIASKLYYEFKQYFSPLLLSKIAKFVHRLELTPSSSLFFSKLKLYDPQVINRQNILIKQQNQINRKSMQNERISQTYEKGNNVTDIQKNNIFQIKTTRQKKTKQNLNSKSKSKPKKQIKPIQLQENSIEDYEKVSKYIEVMIRRFKDYEQFMYHLKKSNLKMQQEMSCTQQFEKNIHLAKKRISLLQNTNSKVACQLNPNNTLTVQQYYRLSMGRKRPYYTERIKKNNQNIGKVKIRFQTQISQEAQVRNKLKRNQSNQKIRLSHQMLNAHIKESRAHLLAQKCYQERMHSQFVEQETKSNRNLSQSQKSIKSNISLHNENIYKQQTRKEFQYQKKSNFFREAQKNNQNKQQNKQNQNQDKIIIQNKGSSSRFLSQFSMKGRTSLNTELSLNKNMLSQEKIDFINQKQQKQVNKPFKNIVSTRNSKIIASGKSDQKQKLHLKTQESQQSATKKQYFQIMNAMKKKGNRLMKRRIGQMQESSQISLVSTDKNLKQVSNKHLIQRRNGRRINNDMQLVFKRLVSDSSIRNLIQNQQIRQINEQNAKVKAINSNNSRLIKKHQTNNKLSRKNSIICEDDPYLMSATQRIFPKSQFLSKLQNSISEQDVKKLRESLKPIAQYNQNKIIQKYGIYKGNDGIQFKLNNIGHLQFNHEYILRFNSTQLAVQKQYYNERIRRFRKQDLKLQISKAFTKKCQQSNAPCQKPLQIQSQFYE